MYFLLVGVVEKFHYLKTGLAIVLTFIGIKMLVVALGIHIPIWFSLIFVAVVLMGSIGISLLWPRADVPKIDIDLPPDYDGPPALEDADSDGNLSSHEIVDASKR
jgi:hypothetical protein